MDLPGSVCSLPGMHVAPESPAGATTGGCLLPPVHGAPAAPATCPTHSMSCGCRWLLPHQGSNPILSQILVPSASSGRKSGREWGLEREGETSPPSCPPGRHYFTFTEETHLFPGSFSLPSCPSRFLGLCSLNIPLEPAWFASGLGSAPSLPSGLSAPLPAAACGRAEAGLQ